MRARAPQRYPAVAASLILHTAALLAGLIIWPWTNKPIHVTSATPVTLVTSNDLADLNSAEQAPTPTPAATPNPVPNAAPQPQAAVEAPEPAPNPVPPQPKPAPPPPKPAQAKPQPAAPKAMAKAAPPKPQAPSFDPDALLASLDRTTKSAGARQSSAARGPARAATALQARLGAGNSDVASQSAMASLQADLQRLWNPNCDVVGAADVQVKVTFRLSASGRLIGQPTSSGDDAADPVVRAAAVRAKNAVYAAEPFDNLPPALYAQPIIVSFNGKQACQA